MEIISVEVEGVKVKGAGGAAGSKGSGSTNSGGTSSSSAAAAVVSKRRKMDGWSGNGGECGDASGDSACVVHCGRFKVAAVEVNLPTAVDHFGAPVGAEEDGERCLSGDVEDPGTASCCSSNERSESVDLEVKSGEVDASTIQSRYRRERIPLGRAVATESDDNGENNRPKPPTVVAAAEAAGNSHRRQLLVRMPLRAEMEDFFSLEEKKAALKFKEKYNFDFEKEEPLIGRYEWKPFTAVAVAASVPAKEKEIIKA